MKSKTITPILLVCFFLAWTGGAEAEDFGKSVNAFYKRLVEILKEDKACARAVKTLVEQDRRIAEQCLTVLDKKCNAPGEKREGYCLLQQKLSEGLLICTPGRDCSPKVISPLTEAVERQSTNEDKILLIETLIRLCPEKGDAYYPRLGDLFFAEGQYGMAVDAYEKSLTKKDENSVRQALGEARRRLTSYEQAKPLSRADFEELVKENRMAPMPGFIRKITPPGSLQTNRILFDEWSYAIKDGSLPELKEVGEALAQELTRNRMLSVSIDGHTDQLGEYEKNMVLSKQRAEAIKKYLIENFRLDPNRLVAKGYGWDKPFSPRKDDKGRAENRRVEFKFLDSAP